MAPWILGTLGVLSLIFGAATLLWFIDGSLRRRYGWSHIRTMVVTLGTVGLFLGFPGLLLNSSLPITSLLCPTSIMLMANQIGDPLWSQVLVFALALLANIVLYGIAGWILGGVWEMISDLNPGK